MSQYRELGEGSKKMAISYASGLPADHTQALPSFRELLPAHLHDEIESTSYFTSRHSARERPGSAHHHHDLTSNSRHPYPSKVPMGEPRDYPVGAVRADDPHPRDHGPMQPRLPGSSPQAAHSTPRYASSRGPSPILPPIRDLQSLPDRGLGGASSTTTAPFPEASRMPRGLDRFAAPDFRSAPPVGAHGYHPSSGPVGGGGGGGDRRSTDAYLAGNGSGPPMIHGQPAPSFPYPGMTYQSDSEQTSHAQQSNFGILGDSMDSKNKRRRGNLPKPVTDILRAWFHDHLDHPYPSEEDKQMFMTRTGLTISQISNWFINARRRQLPALRNQMRNGGELDPQRQSPFSDVDQASTESIPSPHQLGPRP
ncbi:hypothetical protein FE257_002801 [Aspergillus nanangensis]|uniref:Homeobox domain-containing protein n=1 Tax=Aspergillus nanangensis TaxID=2582783 RepID=A0AAD4CC63_ASPNN|nr:hypothetical protein FE257_002801 [Aspergillus nanangensis]